MKKVKKNQLIYVLLVLGAFMQSSCSDYYDAIFEKKTKNAKVETVVQNFQANDGLSVDKDGFVYASNFAGSAGTQVLRVNPENATVDVAVDDLRAPTGNVRDMFGNSLVVHNVRRVGPEPNDIVGDVIKIGKDGSRMTLATLPGFPAGITLDQEGNAYVSNFSFPGVHKISPDGVVSVYIEDPRLLGGVGIDFDNKGNLFVGNFSSGEILKVGTDQSIEVFATIPTVAENFVIGYIVYFAGSIFATGIGEHVIYRVSNSGDVSIFAGSGIQETVDGPLLEASFNTPNGIAVDARKKVLYVTEAGPTGKALRVIKLK